MQANASPTQASLSPATPREPRPPSHCPAVAAPPAPTLTMLPALDLSVPAVAPMGGTAATKGMRIGASEGRRGADAATNDCGRHMGPDPPSTRALHEQRASRVASTAGLLLFLMECLSPPKDAEEFMRHFRRGYSVEAQWCRCHRRREKCNLAYGRTYMTFIFFALPTPPRKN